MAGDLNLAGPGCYGIEIKGKCKGTRIGRTCIPMDPDSSCPSVRIGTVHKFQYVGIIGQHHIRVGQVIAAGYLHIHLDLAAHGCRWIGKGDSCICCKGCYHLSRHHDCHHTRHCQNCSRMSHTSNHYHFPLSDYNVFPLSGLHFYNGNIASAWSAAASGRTARSA